MFDNLAAAAGLIRDGKVTALAVTTAARSALLPEVPTIEESGIRPFDIGTWFGVFTTAGTPAPIVEKLHAAYQAALADPVVVERLAAMGSVAPVLTTAQFADMVRTEHDKYQEIVRLSGAQVN